MGPPKYPHARDISPVIQGPKSGLFQDPKKHAYISYPEQTLDGLSWIDLEGLLPGYSLTLKKKSKKSIFYFFIVSIINRVFWSLGSDLGELKPASEALGQFAPARIIRRSTNRSGTNPAPTIMPGTSSFQLGFNLSPFGINYKKSGANSPSSGANCPRLGQIAPTILLTFCGFATVSSPWCLSQTHNDSITMNEITFRGLPRLQNQHGTKSERLGQIIPAGANCPRLGQIGPAGGNCPSCKI